MTQIREIKCPHCGEWTMWTGGVDDRCLNCNEFLEPQRFSREIEKKIGKELTKENDYFFIKPTDGLFKREIKQFLNSFRWLVYYFQILFFIFISLLLLILTLLAG
jgi:phage FluMu protein Com